MQRHVSDMGQSLGSARAIQGQPAGLACPVKQHTPRRSVKARFQQSSSAASVWNPTRVQPAQLAGCPPDVQRHPQAAPSHSSTVPEANLRVVRAMCCHNEAAFNRALHTPDCSPALTSPQLTTWYEFLSSYGVSNDIMLKVLYDFPDLFNNNIYTAGEAILFFKSYGWKDRDIRQRIVSQWPHLLVKSVPRDFLPVVSHLEAAGCTGKHLRLLVWEYPRIFISRDFRRQAGRFARLGVYGLTPEYLRHPPPDTRGFESRQDTLTSIGYWEGLQ